MLRVVTYANAQNAAYILTIAKQMHPRNLYEDALEVDKKGSLPKEPKDKRNQTTRASSFGSTMKK
jgi:hypothetical protein